MPSATQSKKIKKSPFFLFLLLSDTPTCEVLGFYFREFSKLNHKRKNKNSQNIVPPFINEQKVCTGTINMTCKYNTTLSVHAKVLNLEGLLLLGNQNYDLERLREKSRIFQAKSKIGSCKNQEKSKNILKSYTLPVLVSLPIELVHVGLNVDQIGLTSYDPDSDLVIFEARSALVYSVTVFYLSN